MALRFKFAALALAAQAALMVAATPASADYITGQISLLGFAESNPVSGGMGAATGINFADPFTISGQSGTAVSYAAGTGNFASLGICGSFSPGCATIQDISSFTTEPATTSFLVLNTSGPAVSFDLTSISDVSHTSNGSLTFTALGMINFGGYFPTPGEIIVTAQGSSIVSYSATLSTVPEPATLALLGAGLLGVAASRRRKKAA